MFDDRQSFITRAALEREWALDFKAFKDTDDEAQLLQRLRAWAARPDLRERSAETAFVSTFFVDTWGYGLPGQGADKGFQAYSQFPVVGAGAGGSTGAADLALGWFEEGPAAVPQALCEFKDIRSALDAPQPRKGNTRTPVQQCLDYLAGARRPFLGNEPLLPWWGLVTDMNEFRLYWWTRAPQSYARFVLHSPTPLYERSLTDDSEESRFDRFVFQHLFHRDRLLSRSGKPPLLRLIEKQRGEERALEGEFYQDYRVVRDHLFDALRRANPGFTGTPGRLLRAAQKILDRLIFAFYCEDMGERMLFPPELITTQLVTASLDPFFEAAGEDIWRRLKQLFVGMDAGGQVGQLSVRAFNGGLFRPDPQIEALTLPNSVFCVAGQGANTASIKAHKNTVLHLCGSYNYAARGAAKESISLYTLGRIFEQSITELEIKEAELDGRPSLAKVVERKIPTRRAQGVYYTPEWVVERVVEGALGAWLADRRRALAWAPEATPTLAQLDAYEAQVSAVRVVDPACGSGAFLIGAFRRLLRERLEIAALRRTLAPATAAGAQGERALTAAILDGNLFGVDISAAAVEIAKLALWLHSARADAPLSSLDGAVLCGNSLVGPDYEAWKNAEALSEVEREQVNAFDWRSAFPFPEDPGCFDVVVGNPPYVKLQNLRAVSPDVADYLLAVRSEGFYASTQTGNFDLYLPFIEKGLRLMRRGGRMGYIAPSLWTVNEYGEALRALVRHGRNLTCWIDFKSHQIFNEATTYTALQFFSAEPADAVQVAAAPHGEADVADVRWDDPDLALDYARLPADAPWLMATGEERALIDRLAETCLRLDDPSLTTGIIVGIQTSADSIYHLRRLGVGRYRCTPDRSSTQGRQQFDPYEVELEDAIMRPLVSGAEAKRYEEPQTDTWLIFPYARDAAGRMRLLAAETMIVRYPKTWAYLRSWEPALRAREIKNRGKSNEVRPFDDAEWYRFGRNQNIDKQDRSKLIVPRIVVHLKSTFDERATCYLDNVDVGGVLTHRDAHAAMLNGVLNGPVADFVFRRLSKPFANDYRSANKQFIAPLPVPDVEMSAQAEMARRSRRLQRLGTKRRDLLNQCAERYGACHHARHGEEWLWPGLPRLSDLEDSAPRKLANRRDRQAWAEQRLQEARAERLAALQAHIGRRASFEAAYAQGRLGLTAGGAPVEAVFVSDANGALVEAYWRWIFLKGAPGDADSLAAELRRPPSEAGAEPARQFVVKVAELADVTRSIAAEEEALNERLFALYDLSRDERALVVRG